MFFLTNTRSLCKKIRFLCVLCPDCLRSGLFFIIAIQYSRDFLKGDSVTGNKLYRDILGLFLIFIGLLLLLSLSTLDPTDPSFTHVASAENPVSNKAGLFGAYLGGFFTDMLGLAAYCIPIVFFIGGVRRVLARDGWVWWRWCGFCLLGVCIVFAGEAWKVSIGFVGKGGLLGHALLAFFTACLGSVGTALFWTFVFLLSIHLLTGFSWLGFIQACAVRVGMSIQHHWANRVQTLTLKDPVELPDSEPETSLEESAYPEEQERETDAEPSFLFDAQDMHGSAPVASAESGPQSLPGANLSFLNDLGIDDADPPWLRRLEEGDIDELAVRKPKDSPQIPATEPVVLPQAKPESVAMPEETPVGSTIAIQEAVSTIPAADPESPKVKRAALPPFSLLHTVASVSEKTPREVLEAKGRVLMTCLADFGIQGELVGIAPGPVVTMFEVRPAAGVRVARIENLSDDLALSLKAIAVRVQAPIPGTDTVGIEVPNELREIVCLKELFCSKAFAESKSLLTMALGKDIQGGPAMANLAAMPHLLVAGATGAGKSVCLNSILLSFLYKARPDEVKLLLVDPKRVEMAVYADLPHLVHPVVTEMELAKNALNWAVGEMSRRYNDLALLGVRNIATYNEKLKALDRSLHPDFAHLEFMPYLVIVIDELTDLMMTAAKEVEGYIMRLAQLARAAGIHMILATQRPSVDVVTGLIKANFPCRIAFQTTSRHDSRTILDASGAENLLGRGDMLYKPAGGKVRRLHGAFVRDEDVAAVADYWRSRQKPDYSVDFSSLSNNGDGSGDEEDRESFVLRRFKSIAWR